VAAAVAGVEDAVAAAVAGVKVAVVVAAAVVVEAAATSGPMGAAEAAWRVQDVHQRGGVPRRRLQCISIGHCRAGRHCRG
jgi:hypothetical protein